MAAFFGKYRGIVTDTDDKRKLGRLRALVPDVLGDEECGWALPCSPLAGPKLGWFALPPVGAAVWIEFEQGDPDYPIWAGCFWAEGHDLPEAADDKHIVLCSAAGHRITINDSSQGGIDIETKEGLKLKLLGRDIQIENGNGATIKLSGNKVSINGDALEVV